MLAIDRTLVCTAARLLVVRIQTTRAAALVSVACRRGEGRKRAQGFWFHCTYIVLYVRPLFRRMYRLRTHDEPLKPWMVGDLILDELLYLTWLIYM